MTAPAPGGRMAVRLTVVDRGRTAAPCDVVVEAPAGAGLAEARPALEAAAGLVPGRPLSVGGVVLDGEAVVGRPPLLDGAVVVVGAPGPSPGVPLLEVHVVAGPDAGRRVALGPGVWVVGRGPDATVRVEDPGVSRAHAVVTVAPGEVVVSDLGSTNGTALASAGGAPEPLPDGGPARWEDGARLVVGSSHLVLRDPDEDEPAAAVPDGLGHLLVNRAPRVRVDDPPLTVRFPDPPPPARPHRLPWPALVVPAVVAVPMALVWHQPVFLLLALLTPLALLGQHLVERRGGRRDARRAAADHAAAVAVASENLTAALRLDAARLDRVRPDLGRLTTAAASPTRRLWERSAADEDALVVRLGLGPVPAGVRVEGPQAPAAEHAVAPVTVDLLGAGVLGIAGPRCAATDLARAVVAQVATLHTPQEVRVVVRSSDRDRGRGWSWAAWLPHLDDDPVAALAPGAPVPGDAPGTPAVLVVVLDGAHDLRRDTAVAEILRRAAAQARAADRRHGTPRARVVVLCLDDDVSRLPAECLATVVVGAPGAGAAGLEAVVRHDGRVRRCVPDGLGPGTAARLARDVARLRDATPRPDGSALPARVTLAEVVGLPGPPARWGADLARRWARPDRTPPPLRVALGRGPDGPWTVDLRTDGPHALVAGTTGAGKSELLRTFVAALAAEHPPTEVAVLLVDYKGGTAFAGLEALPHVCGLLTDLDPHGARRTLTALRAELRRRERVLRAAGAADLDAFDRLAAADRAGAAPMPRLVIVVDEFRVLAEELPDLLGGLVRVAAVGRSLGVHLVLATQRPGGVVTADMRANLNLRVALRVRDRTDSDDVVEAPDAAGLPASAPGRAVVRTGGGDLRTVQTALLAVPDDVGGAGDATVRVRVLAGGPAGGGRTAGGPARPPGDEGPPDAVDSMAVACREAVARTGAAAPPAPWLPPLPDVVLLADLPPEDAPGATAGDGPHVVVGLADLPDEQRRAALAWDLGRGHLAVVGGPRSGRTTALRAVVAGLLTRPGTVHVHVHVHVHVLAAPGARTVPSDLPGAGTVATVDDVERAARLLRHLATDPVRARWTVLVVDGWEPVADALRAHDRGRPFDDLVALARDRGADGLRVVAAGGRGLLTGPVGALLPTRLLLPTADPTDLLVAGLAAHELPATMPPGRVLRLGAATDGSRSVVEAQVGLLDRDPAPAAQEAALVRLARALAAGPAQAGRRPLRLVPLPGLVDVVDLDACVDRPGPVDADRTHDGPGGPAAVAVGLGGDDAAPVLLPLPPGEVVLVAGPPGSGRTTALTTLGRQVARAGRPVVRAGPDGVGTAPTPPVVVLADDVDRLPEPVLSQVEELVAAGATAVVAATAADAVVAFRGLLAAARRSRCGLLLGTCGPGEAEVLGVRDAPPRTTVPGRGVVVDRGRATPVQVARTPGATAMGE
ncbi:FtsK/SpoIIIE domain-containing protein [Kineosporia sp. R_H_3]|uniref:FtsK/SpoIIIE domain-containing protein n=1 Tax=Kineosporia sp. R_H_3 TaxID=1961848 RepID=UPI000B4C074D|nr:FtsK/SpoIIIE domain-containing protein [Kineosporia sp. R_H_3]